MPRYPWSDPTPIAIAPTAMPSPPPFASPSPTHYALQHPLLATQTSAVVTTTCLDYLHSHTAEQCAHPRTHGLTDKPLRLLSTDIGCSTLARPSLQTTHTATPAARDSNLDSGNQDMSRLSALAYRRTMMRPSTASPIDLCACYQRRLGVAPSPLSLSPRHCNTRCSRLKPRQWQPRFGPELFSLVLG
jgi:hypothetical protein